MSYLPLLCGDCSLDIVIDCAYDDVHNDKERRSLIRQIQESYGNLRKDRSDVLTHLHVVNPPEQVREIMERWKITSTYIVYC